MNKKGALARVTALFSACLVLTVSISVLPSLAVGSGEVLVGTTKDFSLVTSGTLALDPSARFTGSAPVGVAVVATAVVDSATISSYHDAGIGNFIQNTPAATTAVDDAITLRSQLESLTGVSTAAEMGGVTFPPGVYGFETDAARSIATSMTLDGGGDYNSVFVFRTRASLNVGASLVISAINGARPANIYWVADGAITIGANTNIPGNFISLAAINIGASVVITGSLMAITISATPAGAISIGALATIAHSTRPTLSSWADVSKVYTDAPFSAIPPTSTNSVTGTYSYSSETPTVVSVSGSTLTVVNVGTSRITATFTPTLQSLYYVETATMIVTVGQGVPVVTWTPNTSLLTTASPHSPSSLAQANDSATITYSVTTPGLTSCSVDSATAIISFISAGSCVVKATSAPTLRYQSSFKEVTFVITAPVVEVPPAPVVVVPPAPVVVVPPAPVVVVPPPPPPPAPVVKPEPLPSPSPAPPVVAPPPPEPVVTPEPVVLPEPVVAPEPLPSPSPIVVVIVLPMPQPSITQTPKPTPRPTAPTYKSIEITPIFYSTYSKKYSLNISLHNMRPGQVITITLKEVL